MRLAWFVSPHGFGHAARSCAVIAALRELVPELEVTLFTSVPRWFFEESLSFPFDSRELACDVGLVQRSAVEEDLPATVDRLEAFWREANTEAEAKAKGFHRRELQQLLRAAGADAVVCDIAPLGLLAAREAGLPSILIENFTWDWIYEPLVALEPRFAPWVARMRDLFALANLRIQAEPVCQPLAASLDELSEARPVSSFPSMKVFASSSSVCVPPIARRPRSAPAEVRARLGLAPESAGRPLILVSMGGIPWSFENLERWRAAAEYDFVVPGGAVREQRHGNLVLLPHHSPVYHPDLVAAADLVVGKLGYSTVAEVVAAGSRMLYPPRAGFREHEVLARFVRSRLPAEEMRLEELASARWIERLGPMLGRPRPQALASDGADGSVAAANAIVVCLAANGR